MGFLITESFLALPLDHHGAEGSMESVDRVQINLVFALP
jgi:hypothetical protein